MTGDTVTTWKRESDGATIDEADLRTMAEDWAPDMTALLAARDRTLAALAPKPAPTCGAVLCWPDSRAATIAYSPEVRCVLPPPDAQGFHEGRHKYIEWGAEDRDIMCAHNPRNGTGMCGKPESDPIHWAGHQPAPEVWRQG